MFPYFFLDYLKNGEKKRAIEPMKKKWLTYAPRGWSVYLYRPGWD